MPARAGDVCRQTYSELMGDRAALVVAQSVPVVAALVMKLATGCKALAGALNVDALLEAAHNLDFITSLREDAADQQVCLRARAGEGWGWGMKDHT